MVDLCLLQSCKEFKTEPNVRGIKHSCGFINRNEYETSTFLKKKQQQTTKSDYYSNYIDSLLLFLA